MRFLEQSQPRKDKPAACATIRTLSFPDSVSSVSSVVRIPFRPTEPHLLPVSQPVAAPAGVGADAADLDMAGRAP